jgi:hypothetical protein
MTILKKAAKKTLQKIGLFNEVRWAANWIGLHKTVPHGHQVLIDEITRRAATGETLNGKVCIEIGSTREDVPGQGSTAKLARVCQQHGMKFVTVDMDPENTQRAKETVAKVSSAFEAHNAKGEEYLEAYDGMFDYSYLDAFDIDHDSHSARRRDRYKEILGTDIHDDAYYEMHLSCAKAATQKMPVGGVVSFDDTWKRDGKWLGKGYSALPWFEQSGFSTTRETGNTVLLIRRELST